MTVDVGDTCPACFTCCDGSKVQGSLTNCPTCCNDANGDFLVTTQPDEYCHHRCCADGAWLSGLDDSACDPSSCRTCCDGLSLDTNYDERCNCCADENGEIRNVLNLLGSAGSEITEVCYYCRAFCGGLYLVCIPSGQHSRRE